MSVFYIAQVNIARMLAPLDDPIMEDFVNNLDRINAQADTAAGFVWRLKTDDGNATDIRVFDDDMLIVNMSVWETIDALFEYTYQSNHVDIFRRRKEWFGKLDRQHLALWWVPADTTPTVEQAQERLAHLNQYGPTPFAFNFKQRFSIEQMLDHNA